MTELSYDEQKLVNTGVLFRDLFGLFYSIVYQGIYSVIGAVYMQGIQKRKWQGWRDSNSQPSVLETAVLPIGTTPLQQIRIILMRRQR